MITFEQSEEDLIQIVKDMHHTSLCATDKDGNTALHMALMRGYTKLFNKLVYKINSEAGIIGLANNRGVTVLHLAAARGYKDAVQIVHPFMSDEERVKVDDWGRIALHCAIANNHIETAKYMLMQKGGIRCDKEGNFISYINEGIDVELSSTDIDGYTVLHSAINRNQEEICRMLISRMSSVALSVKGYLDQTVLHRAVREGMPDICKLLIEKMSTYAINIEDKEGKTAFHWAASRGYNELCTLLKPKMYRGRLMTVHNNGTILHDLMRK